MESQGINKFPLPMSTLPLGVVACGKVPYAYQKTKYVTLTNNSKENVAKRTYHTIDVNLIIDMDGKSITNNPITIQIAKSLCKVELLCTYMWSLHS